VTFVSELDDLDRIAGIRIGSSIEPYVPVLRLRPGEVSAMFNLSREVAAAICPVFTVPPPTTAGAAELEFDVPLSGALQSARELLRRLCSQNHLLFTSAISKIWLDCWRLDNASKSSMFGKLLSDPSVNGGMIVPVAISEQGSQHMACVRDHYRQYENGMMVRISITRFDIQKAIETARRCAVDREKTDLLIDVGLVTEQNLESCRTAVSAAIAAASHTPWRSIGVVAGSIAEPFRFRDSQRGIPRREVEIWRSAIAASPRIRLGDYTSIAPVFLDGRPRTALPSLRYSGRNQTLVIRRRKDPVSNALVYGEMCAAARAWEYYDATATDWGTRQINDGAAGAKMSLQKRFWTAIGVAHHIEVASRQIRGGF
jgi:hypothetical protein